MDLANDDGKRLVERAQQAARRAEKIDELADQLHCQLTWLQPGILPADRTAVFMTALVQSATRHLSPQQFGVFLRAMADQAEAGKL